MTPIPTEITDFIKTIPDLDRTWVIKDTSYPAIRSTSGECPLIAAAHDRMFMLRLSNEDWELAATALGLSRDHALMIVRATDKSLDAVSSDTQDKLEQMSHIRTLLVRACGLL